MKKRINIFILSDSTGRTAEMVITAALVQFQNVKPVFKRFPYIKTKDEIRHILRKARAVKGIVIYSIVSGELRDWFLKQKRTPEAYLIDLLGPIIQRIEKQWEVAPVLTPGLLRGVGEKSLRVAEAVDFTLNHDDGQGVETLGKADVIILGVSRTSKTPTSLYLACNHGLKVANVPLIAGMSPVRKVFTMRNRKIGLFINPERLFFLRKQRWKPSEATVGYVDILNIRKELDYSLGIFRQIRGLEKIDVTDSSIEEVAVKILELGRLENRI